MDDDLDDDGAQFLPLKYPWREFATFAATMLVLLWCLWGFAKYVWEYFLG
jgi:hypothetical protein